MHLPPFDTDVDPIVAQYAEQTSFLWHLRANAVYAPNFSLRDLNKLEDRIAACIDGLRVAGDSAWIAWEADQSNQDPGSLFAPIILALETQNRARLDALLSHAETVALLQKALISAFGWTSPRLLQGIAKDLLDSTSTFNRRVGIACCAIHRVGPGPLLAETVHHDDPALRSRSLRAVGELGQHDLQQICARAQTDEHVECRFWATWSSLLLGDRTHALQLLADSAITEGPFRQRAFRFSLQAMSVTLSHRLLQKLAQNGCDIQWLISGSGIAGDARYIPWLIGHMKSEKTARLAGEAFSLVTGTDLTVTNLERRAPEDFESGPNDNPEDKNVAMDPDEGLPWPDADKVEQWWAANASRFQEGTRYFMGAPVTREHCIDVLKNGHQRQRILAAHYLCLLEPGTPLFNTSAPAWRQQRLLSRL